MVIYGQERCAFFYPAISTSILFSEVLKEMGLKSDDRVFSFGKFRASWARVGKDAPPYVLATTLGTTTNSSTINQGLHYKFRWLLQIRCFSLNSPIL
ncbi:hypothetical protein CS542_04995 [Pedobacter sp. IW39]|nr:hypothetical protein CS542_04995 [Pedobacter sp. IW39]